MAISLKSNLTAPKSPMIGHNNPPVTEKIDSDGDKVVAINVKSDEWKEFDKAINEAVGAEKKINGAIFHAARIIQLMVPERVTYKSDAGHDVTVSRSDALKGMFANSKLRSVIRALLLANYPKPDPKEETEAAERARKLYNARKTKTDRALHVASVVGTFAGGKWSEDGSFAIPFRKAGKDGYDIVPGAISILRAGEYSKIDGSTLVTFGQSKSDLIVTVNAKNKREGTNASFNTLWSTVPWPKAAQAQQAGKGKAIIGNAETLIGLLDNPGTKSEALVTMLTALRAKIDKVLGIVETTTDKASKSSAA